MRVAVHHPPRTEPDGTEIPETVAAFRQGRIEDFANPLTGETTPKEKVAEILLEQAKAEFPDCGVKLEVLVHNGDGEGEGENPEDAFETRTGTSTWVPHDQVPEGAVSSKGATVARELSVEQDQAAGGGEAQ
jgi:hypothetical protein